MYAFDEVHGKPSQLELHAINKTSDFTFCDIPKRKHYLEQDENKNPLGFSPPLWSKNLHSNCKGKGSSSSIKNMVEGRKELMEMINDLPESWYELSLKDMVVDQDPDDSGLVREEKADLKPKLKGKKKGAKRGPISRSVSLNTGVFLLKMFVPSSFGSKKQTVSRSTSTEKRDNDVKEWKTLLFAESSRSYNNDRCNTATKNRYEEGTLKPGCCFKSTNQKWCIFF